MAENVTPLRREPANVRLEVSVPGDAYHSLCESAAAQRVSVERYASLLLRAAARDGAR